MLSFLKTNGEEKMADAYAFGIRDYANEKYQKNYDYPEEWFEETERIDEWISNNEGYIYKWMYDLILEYKSEILMFGDN